MTITMAPDNRVKRLPIRSDKIPTKGNEITLPIDCAALTTPSIEPDGLPKYCFHSEIDWRPFMRDPIQDELLNTSVMEEFYLPSYPATADDSKGMMRMRLSSKRCGILNQGRSY